MLRLNSPLGYAGIVIVGSGSRPLPASLILAKRGEIGGGLHGSETINHKIAPPEEWLAARTAHLAREKELTQLRDLVSAERSELPYVQVDKAYSFEGPNGSETLGEWFAGRSQLIIYHFMFGPGWPEGCPSCSFLCDHIDGSVVHLASRNVTLLAASRAPLAEIDAFKARMGWSFKLVSSHVNDFNRDYHVSFTAKEMAAGEVYYNYRPNKFPSEEAPDASVFLKDESGAIYHTYSCYGCGLDILIGTFNFLDLAPNGRGEAELPWPMSWIRHHDRYDEA